MGGIHAGFVSGRMPMTTELNDSVLLNCNETELLALARTQGIGRLRRGMPKEVLISIVSGEIDALPEHFADTIHTRKMLEDFIQKHWGQVRSQLPGCDGRCTTYPCSEGRHALCYSPNKETAAIK